MTNPVTRVGGGGDGPTPFYLHYVGGRVYATPERFIKEAKKHGVARAIPKEFLKKLSWGDCVLLGNWARNDGQPSKGAGRQGKATVFGLFYLTGVSISASARVKAWINKRLHIDRIETVNNGEGEYVERGCGSYTITSVAFVSDPLYRIVEIVQDAEREFGEKVRMFMAGGFKRVDPEVILDPVGFTRTITTVFLQAPKWEPFQETKDRAAPVTYILDYASRRYVPKAVRERLYGETGKAVKP